MDRQKANPRIRCRYNLSNLVNKVIEDLCLMAIGRSKEVRHPLLKKLKSMKALIRFVHDSGDRQWSSRVGAPLFHVLVR